MEENHLIVPGRHPIEPFVYQVPADLSSAAFPITAALVTGSEMTLTNIDINDPQGDKEAIFALQRMGAQIEIEEKTLTVKKSPPLKGLEIDMNNMIDAVCILAVAGCFAEGTTRLYNASVARYKECDRLASMVEELSKMGASIEETEDGLLIRKSRLKGADLDSHGDHRTAMSLIVAALAAEGESRVKDTGCIAKTYPSFLSDFQSAGAFLEAES